MTGASQLSIPPPLGGAGWLKGGLQGGVSLLPGHSGSDKALVSEVLVKQFLFEDSLLRRRECSEVFSVVPFPLPLLEHEGFFSLIFSVRI